MILGRRHQVREGWPERGGKVHAQDPQVHPRGLRSLQLRDHGVCEARRGFRDRVPARGRRYK